MNRRRMIILGIVTVSVIIGAGLVWISNRSPDIRLQPDNPASVAHGKAIYAAQCASCHGANLEGQANWRERLPNGRLPAPPHDQSGHTWHHSDEQLFMLTNLGPEKILGNGYQSDMPGFGSKLSHDEIIDVLSFIKSTWPDEVRRRHDLINARAKVPGDR